MHQRNFILKKRWNTRYRSGRKRAGKILYILCKARKKQGKVGKMCLILWENVDIMIPADDKSPVCGEEGKLQIG